MRETQSPCATNSQASLSTCKLVAYKCKSIADWCAIQYIQMVGMLGASPSKLMQLDYFGKQLHNTQDPPCRTLGSQDRSEPTFDDVQKLRHKAASPKQVIGASLSEPYTSMTAFAEVVCMSVCPWPYTVNFK